MPNYLPFAVRVVVASFASWIPMLAGDHLGQHHWPTVTVAMPVVAVLGAFAVASAAKHWRPIRWVSPLVVLLGVWATGPVAMCASERLADEVCTARSWDLGFTLALAFPLTTPYMSIYHAGATYGLVLVTVALIAYAVGGFALERMRRGA